MNAPEKMNAPGSKTFDRAAESLGNIVLLEHVNLRQDDQRIAALFYAGGLGLTRDPYLHVIDVNMWFNCGRQQFHMPTAKPQRLRGVVGIVLPDLDALLERLESVTAKLDGTHFAFARRDDHVEAVCPWGNRFRIHAPQPRFGRMRLGIPYVELNVPRGTAAGIVRFYAKIMLAPARVERSGEGEAAHVRVGPMQEVVYREGDGPLPDYDGHHIAIYIADFAGPHAELARRGLVFEESDQWQYRFKDLVDPDSGAPLFTLEHEVRSLTHPLFARPLVNRNPAQTQGAYTPGQDAFY
ncbi:MAG: VOC family protein [Burkholderiales bacterium]